MSDARPSKCRLDYHSLLNLGMEIGMFPAASKVLHAGRPSIVDRVGLPRTLNSQLTERLGDQMLAEYIKALVRK